eukprot:TRINITY_DN482_c0_g2_i1.p1 TRINITY_DN482_c0_g2~~TRINITY_DN482_c0_g2_i1.p1  ORF type:complete len:737 (+),score=190.58 TRINITY_DN482_c0_g2_i1:97-2307(+)
MGSCSWRRGLQAIQEHMYLDDDSDRDRWRKDLAIRLALVWIPSALFVTLFAVVQCALGEFNLRSTIGACIYTGITCAGCHTSYRRRSTVAFALSMALPLHLILLPIFYIHGCSFIDRGQPYPFLVIACASLVVQIFVREPTWVRNASIAYVLVTANAMLLAENFFEPSGMDCLDEYQGVPRGVSFIVMCISYTLLLVLATCAASAIDRAVISAVGPAPAVHVAARGGLRRRHSLPSSAAPPTAELRRSVETLQCLAQRLRLWPRLLPDVQHVCEDMQAMEDCVTAISHQTGVPLTWRHSGRPPVVPRPPHRGGPILGSVQTLAPHGASPMRDHGLRRSVQFDADDAVSPQYAVPEEQCDLTTGGLHSCECISAATLSEARPAERGHGMRGRRRVPPDGDSSCGEVSGSDGGGWDARGDSPVFGEVQESPEPSPQRYRVDTFPYGPPRQLPGGFGRACTPIAAPKYTGTWDWWLDPEHEHFVSGGGSLFYMTCRSSGEHLSPHERALVEGCINVSSFQNEAEENGALRIDFETGENAHFTFMQTAGVYFIPGVRPGDYSPELLSSFEYQRSCLPGSTKAWDNVPEKSTFRITKRVLPVWSFTIQFLVSVFPQDQLHKLSVHMGGLEPHFALLMERTRRNKTAQDFVKKAKSLLIFHYVPGCGALAVNHTVLAVTYVPRVIAAIMHRLGAIGAHDVAETATRTRRYLREVESGDEGEGSAGSSRQGPVAGPSLRRAPA